MIFLYPKNFKGFSLIELLVTVTIIGILAAISVPMYQNYVMRGYRADAQAALMEGAIRMQRFFTANNTFATANVDDAFGNITTIPANAPNPMYNLGFDGAPTAGAYTLVARPANVQVNDECGELRILSDGRRTAAQNTCWQ